MGLLSRYATGRLTISVPITEGEGERGGGGGGGGTGVPSFLPSFPSFPPFLVLGGVLVVLLLSYPVPSSPFRFSSLFPPLSFSTKRNKRGNSYRSNSENHVCNASHSHGVPFMVSLDQRCLRHPRQFLVCSPGSPWRSWKDRCMLCKLEVPAMGHSSVTAWDPRSPSQCFHREKDQEATLATEGSL